MMRGDVVLTVVQRDFGKLRPAVVVQGDQSRDLDSVTICLLTSDLVADSTLRVAVEPTPENGLRTLSQVQADKVQTVRRQRIRDRVGHLSAETMRQVDVALALHLNLYAAKP